MTSAIRNFSRQSRGVLPALGAVIALIALMVGVPFVLVGLAARLPLDPSALNPSTWSSADDGRLLLMAVLAAAWIAWAALALSVVLESWAAVRRTATPQLPGLAVPQRAAAVLVAAVLVALSSSGTAGPPDTDAGEYPRPHPVALTWAGTSVDGLPVAAGQPGSLAAAVAAVARPPAAGSVDGSGLLAAQPRAIAEPPMAPRAVAGSQRAVAGSEGPRITTQRHDTLWILAEAHLGAGERYQEIVALNQGVPQPDGRSLGTDGRLYPGWTLVLPTDAVTDVDRPERHRVVRGDTLWDIAGEELGDPTRYPEIVEANQGDLQVDGRRLGDPDLIMPGWILELPGTESSPSLIRTSRAGSQDVPEDHQGAGRGGDESPSLLDRAPRSGSPYEGPGESIDPQEPSSLPGAEATNEAAPASPGDALPQLDRAGPDASEPPDLDVAGGVTSLPRGGALATLLLAGIGLELVRRRRQFQRYRRPGERLPVPSAHVGQVESAARSALHDPSSELLERALSLLADAAETAGRPVPDVRLVRVGVGAVTLDLAAPDYPPLAPFRSDDGSRWELDADLIPAFLPVRPSALAGLVTLGVFQSEVVLINLESVGTLVVSGPDEALGDVLRALAAELALGPASALTERTLCISDAAIADSVEAGAIGVQSDADQVSALLAGAMAMPGSKVSGDGTPRDHRAQDPLQIVLSDQALNVAVDGHSGCGLITTAAVCGRPGAFLVVDGSGSATLLPERQVLTPQTLSRSATDDVVEAFRGADLRDSRDEPDAGIRNPVPAHPASDPPPGHPADVGQASLWDPDPEEARAGELPSALSLAEDVIDLRERPADRFPGSFLGGAASAAGASPAGQGTASRGVPRVLLLGEVLVENAEGKAESTRIGRLAETAAFVLLHPGARPSELQGALWPGRRSNPQTCRQMISRTRTWLGRTPAGEPYLMAFASTEGRLRMRTEVTSDWDEFRRLAAIGLADAADTVHLADALALVRGRPFGAVAARELPWADLHINEMIAAITDVAHALATRLEQAGDRSAAHDAALRGLLTECESEVLEAIVARTAP